MASCELCGKSTDSLKKVKIEGAKLKVCDSCSDMGEEVETPSKKRKKKKKKQKTGSRTSQDTLHPEYGSRVKQAREDKQLSIQELADDLNEKQSLISKVEKQDLKPDKTLANKLSSKLGVELYTNPEVSDVDTQNTDSRNATMEDVADIKD
ncbi:MAG: multiprotein bridging factor aMBF1 [Candidatus Nanohaloarchaea archaeon]